MLTQTNSPNATCDAESQNGKPETYFNSAATIKPLTTTGKNEHIAKRSVLSSFLNKYIKITDIRVADVPTTVSTIPTGLKIFAIKQPSVIEIM